MPTHLLGWQPNAPDPLCCSTWHRKEINSVSSSFAFSAAAKIDGTVELVGSFPTDQNAQQKANIRKPQTASLCRMKLPVPIQSLSCGWDHILCVSTEGITYSWGWNKYGQLGLGPAYQTVPRTTSPEVVALHHVAYASAGEKHSLFITKSGSLYSCGKNSDGLLGIEEGDCAVVHTPVRVNIPLSKKCGKVAAGASHSAAITKEGHLYTWGLGLYGALGHGTTATRLAPTRLLLCGCRMGDQEPPNAEVVCKCGVGFSDFAVTVSCGIWHTVAVTSLGAVYSWGLNQFGQLGVPGRESSFVPLLVEGIEDQIDIIKVVCGARHTVALTSTGRVLTWGDNTYGQCGEAPSLDSTQADDARGEEERVSRSDVGGPAVRSPKYVSSFQPSETISSKPATKIGQIAAGHWHTLILEE